MDEAVLKAKVTPRASSNRIEFDAGQVRIYVTAAAIDGQANQAAVLAISKLVGVPKSRIRIAAGVSSRNKSIRIGGITQSQLDNLIKEKIS
ncbi:MAG: DUF167 domain-containing protein [Fimbriimonadales bacterium]|nr:DUF167 domain-containing protein [Fimbriimonadales bacterium]